MRVRVRGALPVTFRADGYHVIIEVVVPFVAPTQRAKPDAETIAGNRT